MCNLLRATSFIIVLSARSKPKPMAPRQRSWRLDRIKKIQSPAIASWDLKTPRNRQLVVSCCANSTWFDRIGAPSNEDRSLASPVRYRDQSTLCGIPCSVRQLDAWPGHRRNASTRSSQSFT